MPNNVYEEQNNKYKTKKEIIANIKRNYVRIKFMNSQDKYQFMFELLQQWYVEIEFWEKQNKYRLYFKKIRENLKWFMDIPKNYKKRYPEGMIIKYPLILMSTKLSEVYSLLDRISMNEELV